MASPAAILTILVEAQTGKATTQLRKFNAEVVNSGHSADKTSKTIGGKLTKAVKLVGLAAAGGAAYGLYKAVGAGATFERQMSSLGAVSEASARQIKAFEEQALKLGESTQYTANQVAEAQTELAKGGLTAKQILGGALPAALSLAAAGQLELAEAAETTVNVMKLFGLQGKDTQQIADMLATAANKTTADVSDFAMALKQGGSVAKLAGLSLNETVTILESLAEAGIKNSDAGTSMKVFFQKIGNPSTKAKKAMEELNLSLFDQEGRLKKLPAVSAELQRAFGDLTKQEFLKNAVTIAGTDSIRTLYALYKEGPAKIRALEQANAKQGTAAKVAAEKMDNLKGDWEQFTGALETGGIKLYRVIKGPLREATQAATGVVQELANTDYGEVWEEIEGFYNNLHNATKVEAFGSNFSLFPETGELEASSQWIINASKNTFNAVVKGYEWTENAALNSYHAISSGVGAVITGWNAFTGAIKGGAAWISRAASNVSGFVKSFIPFKVAALLAYLAISKLVEAVKFAIGVVRVFMPLYQAAAKVIGTVLVAAFHVAIPVIQAFLKFIGNVGAVVGDVVGLVSNLLRGKWGVAWNDAKQLVVDVWHTVIDLLKGGWKTIRTLFSAGAGAIKSIVKTAFGGIKGTLKSAADFLGESFKGAWGKIEGVFTDGANAVIGVINKVIEAINAIPGVPNIGKIAPLGGSSSSASEGNLGKTRGANSYGKNKKQRGGPINLGKPSGDSVPALLERGEYVLNRKAVNAVGKKQLDAINFGAAPRFQKGGAIGLISGGDVLGALGEVGKKAVEFSPPGLAVKAAKGAFDVAKSAADVIGNLPSGAGIPEPFSGVGPYLVDKVTSWIKGLPGSIFGGLGGGKASGSVSDHPELQPGISAIVATILKKWPGLAISSTTGGGHAENSYHYMGRAADLAGSIPYMLQAAAWIKSNLGGNLTEGIHNPNLSIKYGEEVSSGYWGPEVWADHVDHIHVAKQLGGLVQKLQSGGAVVKTVGSILARNGLDLVSSAGILGNAYGESAWNTEAMEPGTHNGGLWGFTTSPVALSDLEAFASSQGKPWGSAEVQTQFMLHHLDAGLRNKMNAASTTDSTTSLFMHEWERPENYSSLGKRQEAAHTALKMLEGAGVKGPTKAQEEAHSYKEDVPAEWHGVKAGQSIKFPGIPKTLQTISAEKRKRQSELAKYRRVADLAKSKNLPAIAQAIQQNVTALEGRIRELHHALTKARLEAAQKKITRHLGKSLGKLTGAEQHIELTEGVFNEHQEIAEHIVDLEPQMPEWPESMSNVARAFKEQQFNERFTAYVNKQETPAYEGLMGIANDWRNQILRAEHVAAGDWAAKGPLGGMEGNWESKIFQTISEVGQIEALEAKAHSGQKKAQDDLATFRSNHGQSAELPDWLKEELKQSKALTKKAEKENERLPLLNFREKELRNFLGQAQAEFYPGGSRISENPTPPNQGTGTLEGMLENLQGRRWPELHEMMGRLPSKQDAHGFGGIIWGLQEQLKELQLKLPGPVELGESEFGGEGGSGASEGGSFLGEGTAGNSFSFASIFSENWDEEMQAKVQHAQEVAQKSAEYWEEQTKFANQRNAVFTRQSPIIDAYVAKNFAGMFAKGGSIPAGMWGIAGEAGPEPVFGPATVVSNRDATAAVASAAGSGTNGVARVVIEDHRVRVFDRDDKEIEAVVQKMNRQAGRRAKTSGARNAGRLS